MALTLVLAAAEDTERLGRALGEAVRGGLVLRLHGPLGAGKTSLVQGVARGLGIPDRAGVRSPSYALIRVHAEGRLPLVHVDLYRLEDPDELVELGLEEWFDGGALIAVEWADRFPGEFPAEGLDIRLSYREDDEGREVALAGRGPVAEELLRALIAALGGGVGDA